MISSALECGTDVPDTHCGQDPAEEEVDADQFVEEQKGEGRSGGTETGDECHRPEPLDRTKYSGNDGQDRTDTDDEGFQQGIGTGACGPAIMPEYQYSARKDYELRFLIQVS